jgi:TonB family protein
MIRHSLLITISCFVVLSSDSQSTNNKKDSSWNANTIISICPLRFPKEAEKNNISGSVELMFDMDSTCAYVNFRIVKSLGYGCDEAAISAIRDCRVIHRGSNTMHCKPVYDLKRTVTFNKAEQ